MVLNFRLLTLILRFYNYSLALYFCQVFSRTDVWYSQDIGSTSVLHIYSPIHTHTHTHTQKERFYLSMGMSNSMSIK